MDGKDFKEITPITQLFSPRNHEDKIETGKWYDSTFFEFKCFKKGTIHLKWKSESLWSRFNQAAAKAKNWLGC
jgi:hypothetical protein